MFSALRTHRPKLGTFKPQSTSEGFLRMDDAVWMQRFISAIRVSLTDLAPVYSCLQNRVTSLWSPRGLTFTCWGCCGLSFWHKPTKFVHSFFFGGGGIFFYNSVSVSISVFMSLWTAFHSINYPDNSPLPHSVLPVLFLPYWSFLLHLFMKVSFSPDIIIVCNSAEYWQTTQTHHSL